MLFFEKSLVKTLKLSFWLPIAVFIKAMSLWAGKIS